MSIRGSHTTTMLLVFAVLLTALSLPGCARHRDPEQNQMQMGQGSMGSGSSDRSSHFVRSPEGQNYYVDTRGQRHVIVREVREAPGATGGLYYIENDERGYMVEESGRLYYREPTGRVLYYEDISSPRASETVVIERGPGMYAPRMSAESCESQYQQCTSGCQGISPRQRYDRPNCMNNCDTIRRGCLGR